MQGTEDELKAGLNRSYPILNPSVTRTPLLNEARAVALLGLNLYSNGKREEVLQLYGNTIDSFKGSRVAHEFQYKTYGLTAANYAAISLHDGAAIRVIRNALRCGSMSYIDVALFVLSYNSVHNDQQALVRCRDDSRYFAKIAYDEVNLERLKRYVAILGK